MTKRIFRSICFVSLVVFLSSMMLIMGVLYHYFSDAGQAQLRIQTGLAAQGVTNEGIVYFHNLEVIGYRITWIDPDGNILYDSESDRGAMENHLEREEVQKALAEGYGESRRYSDTLMERSFYCARKLADGSILRLSMSQKSVLPLLLGMIRPVCILFILTLILSISLAVSVARKIVKPLNEINLDHPLSNKGYEELLPFLIRFDIQQKKPREQKAELLQRENELHTIIGSMNEGMILFNQKGKIISINAAAERLLDAGAAGVGADILSVCGEPALQKIVSDALQGRAEEQMISLQGECYQVAASPITSGHVLRGAALFFFHVTERQKAEQMRREFTANVSHELKTPLHSISGYAELLKNDMVRETDRAPFAGKIYDEAQRMIRLVEDIISLSRLDEGIRDMQCEPTDLYRLAEMALQSLETQAAAAGVAVKLTGHCAIINGIPRLLYSLIYNLCDNAVKYNQENGRISVDIQKKDSGVILTVADNGMGIAPEHQERIFERFYRADKSRSKAAGGTGLGLSIVKHAAQIHDAKIEMKSRVGEGTVMTVTFPVS